jgi:hypothetical protein
VITRPPEWQGTLASLPRAIQAAPRAWARADDVLGSPALALFTGATLSTIKQKIAARLVSDLATAAAKFEPELPTLGASESLARVQWRQDISELAAVLAEVDGFASTGTPEELNARIAAARARMATLAPGAGALLQALPSARPEPGGRRSVQRSRQLREAVFQVGLSIAGQGSRAPTYRSAD